MKLRWPRGRYNHQRIIGFRLRVVVFPNHTWGLKLAWNWGQPFCNIGPLVVNMEPCYEE